MQWGPSPVECGVMLRLSRRGAHWGLDGVISLNSVGSQHLVASSTAWRRTSPPGKEGGVRSAVSAQGTGTRQGVMKEADEQMSRRGSPSTAGPGPRLCGALSAEHKQRGSVHPALQQALSFCSYGLSFHMSQCSDDRERKGK